MANHSDGLCGFSVALSAEGQTQAHSGLSPFPLFEAQEVRVISIDQPCVGEAEVSIITYYDVVQDLNQHNIRGKDQVLGYLFIVIAGLRISGRMVVDED